MKKNAWIWSCAGLLALALVLRFGFSVRYPAYALGAVAAGILYFFFAPGGSLWKEYGKLNWAPVVLGLVIIGLEAGWICAYKAGWPVSVGFIVQSAFLAVVLLLVGYGLYHEPLSWSKIVGVVICLIGLVFLNR